MKLFRPVHGPGFPGSAGSMTQPAYLLLGPGWVGPIRFRTGLIMRWVKLVWCGSMGLSRVDFAANNKAVNGPTRCLPLAFGPGRLVDTGLSAHH